MRALLVFAAALVLAASAAAARGPHDPQEQLTAADNAKARSFLVKRSDLVGRWKVTKSTSGGDDPPCKTFDPDRSDLTLTGKAESPDFERTADGITISSAAEVYASPAELRASFDRSIRPQLVPCVDAAFRSGAGQARVKLLVGRRAPVPRLGERTARYQLIWSIAAGGETFKAYADVYFLGRGRNGLTVFFFSSPAQIAAAAQLELVRRVAGRL